MRMEGREIRMGRKLRSEVGAKSVHDADPHCNNFLNAFTITSYTIITLYL